MRFLFRPKRPQFLCKEWRVEPLTFAVDGSGEKVEFQELVSVEVVAQAPAGGATVLLKI